MGLNNTESLRFVIDIETAPLPDAAAYLEPAEAPSNYKDPAKIEAYIAEKNAENLNRASLDVDLCRIVAIGWQREDWNEPIVQTIDAYPGEADLLSDFWQDIGQHVTVGYNTLGFDLPVLLRRSLYLGVYTPAVNLDRYRTNHIDLQQRLSFNGLLKYRPLAFYCKRFGIACDDTTEGKDIAGLIAANDWAGVTAHCRADVVKTRVLAKRMGFLKMQLQMEEAAF